MYTAFTLEPWHWLILLFTLMGMEALGASGFLLGSAAASAVVAFWIWVTPDVTWPVQLLTFGFFSLFFSIGYWKLFRKLNNSSDNPDLNNRASQLIGTVIVLKHDLPKGQSKLQIGDTFWKVESDHDITLGKKISVTGHQGMVLLVTELE